MISEVGSKRIVVLQRLLCPLCVPCEFRVIRPLRTRQQLTWLALVKCIAGFLDLLFRRCHTASRYLLAPNSHSACQRMANHPWKSTSIGSPDLLQLLLFANCSNSGRPQFLCRQIQQASRRRARVISQAARDVSNRSLSCGELLPCPEIAAYTPASRIPGSIWSNLVNMGVSSAVQ